jgi:hypothetical protein
MEFNPGKSMLKLLILISFPLLLETKSCLGIKPDWFILHGKINYCACAEEVIILQIPLSVPVC